MSNPSDNEKPWRRLYHGTATEDNIQQQQPQQQQSEELTDLQQQLLTWYRRTCLVSGAGMAGSALYWNKYTKHTRQNVFLPPRAQSLPQAHVTAWRQKAQMKDALRTVGQQTLFITWVAALYFGVELGMGVWRYKPGDWLNTAAAGATAGAYLGARGMSWLDWVCYLSLIPPLAASNVASLCQMYMQLLVASSGSNSCCVCLRVTVHICTQQFHNQGFSADYPLVFSALLCMERCTASTATYCKAHLVNLLSLLPCAVLCSSKLTARQNCGAGRPCWRAVGCCVWLGAAAADRASSSSRGRSSQQQPAT
eukprot:GHRR01025597.1.p1 GENE.GHRR01025597.1~~GHRR01025597.1.p1  ORF type:complete len:309 (+),score=83.48 GHRR01025597.1:216-1142(+)